MLILLIKGNKIYKTKIPNKPIGNYWVKDVNQDGEYNLINICTSNGNWILNGNDNIVIVDEDKEKKYSYLKYYNFYLLKNKSDNTYILLYCCPLYDTTYTKYTLSNTNNITIGKNQTNYIYFNTSGIDEEHATIINTKDKLVIIDNDSRLGVYVNDKRINKKRTLDNGDVIFIVGLKIIVIFENNERYLIVNNPDNLVKCRLKEVLKPEVVDKNKLIDTLDSDEILNVNLYKKNDYFYNKYRSKNKIDNVSILIEEKKEVKQISISSFYMTIITGIIISLILIVLSILNGIKGGIVISVILLITMLLYPLIIKKYNKKITNLNDLEYEKYLSEQNNIIENIKSNQKNTLLENSKDIKECEQIILSSKDNLWERKLKDDDFLNINLGLTDLSMNIDIKSQYKESINNTNIKDAPLNISLMTNKILGIIGITKLCNQYVRQIILQLSALHRYDELKIIVFSKQINKDKWNYIRILPHIWSTDKKTRFLATNEEEVNLVCNYLYSNKSEKEYYVLITDDVHYLYKNNLLNKMKDRLSVIIMNENLNNISSLCTHIILLNDSESTYYENKLNGINNKFKAIFNYNIDMYKCSKVLANIPIDIIKNELPNKYTFMQMYKVGNIQQLNIYNRWNTNNTELTLSAKVGVDIYGESIDINLHKDYDGTHFLIQGIPGAGKTEFLTTYILSMAINYNPLDVQFIIMSSNKVFNNIFYKEDENIKLPHLIGVVDYDTYTLKRFMTTIKSELIRRRILFNKVSQNFNLNNIDIYTYQHLYHNKLVTEEIPHIFIIIDEYEELESKHHNFIKNLLKISHIGPILGIHYVFTTDKKESINDIDIFTSKVLMHNLTDDDCIVNNPGRFYLKTKNNNIILGQSASSYYIYNESEQYNLIPDTYIEFIDNVGRVIKRENKISINNKIDTNNTELNNILMYLSNLNNYNISELFLKKLDSYKTVASLMKNYEVNTKKYVVEPIVGEYENLYIPKHDILKITLTGKNNLIYSIDKNEYETFLSTMLFSSMYLYTPSEVNYYVINLGTNILSSYKSSPLVGDIVNIDNLFKLENLFKLIKIKIDERKDLFKDYDNSYEEYIRKTNELVPLLVIVVNNYKEFNNKCENYIYDLTKLLDYKDYGISVVVSNDEVVDDTISYKFDQIFTMKLNNNKDYNSIFNEDISNYPEPYNGRGLTKLEGNVCEFQVAFTNAKNKPFNTFVEKQCIECCKEYKNSASTIPVLPDKLTLKQVKQELGKTDEMIIGYGTDLKLVKYDFNNKNTTIISGVNYDIINKFTKPLTKQFAYLNRNDVIVFDALNNSLNLKINNIKYICKDFDENFILLQDYINNIYIMNKDTSGHYNLEKHRTIFINGINKLYNQLSTDNKEKLAQLINKSSMLDIVNFVIIDSIDNQQKLVNNSWYRNIFNDSDCIWVGNGLSNQSIISTSTKVDNDISSNYCYVITSGIPTLTQYVESFDVTDK